MRFSVLLPTHDRLELLRFAIESVRRQGFDDWEIIVSDSSRREGVQQYIESLADGRIKWYRTDGDLPVTDNWNNALSKSEGDYVVMLGDDDCLLPGYFEMLATTIEDNRSPDALYVDALQFAYPGVFPDHPKGFIQTAYTDLFQGEGPAFTLSMARRVAAVRKSMAIRLSFSYNMQHFLLSRPLIERLATFGPLFQSPYPDYYASNLVMLEAGDVIVLPLPLVAIGISPKSFGYYYLNDRADEGSAMLGSFSERFVPEAARSKVMAGNPLLTGWFLAMGWLERNAGQRHGVRVATSRYRYLQVAHAVQMHGLRGMRRYWPLLSASERVRFTAVFASQRLVLHALPGDMGRRVLATWLRHESPWPPYHPELRTVEFRTILELFESMRPRPATPGLMPEVVE